MSKITLLDGSIGQEIVHRSGDRPTPLWSTSVMAEHPGLVTEVHEDYFRAGATIATVNSYAILRDRLVAAGLEDQFFDLIDRALTEAETARSNWPDRKIAGAFGPMGSSYRTDRDLPAETAARDFAERAALMADRVDLFLIETAASLTQVKGALQGVSGMGVPVWLAVTVDDDDGTRLRSGEPLDRLSEALSDHPPEAVLINCSRPEAVGTGLTYLGALGLPFGAYANGFTDISEGFLVDRPTVAALEKRHDLGPEDYARHVMSWVDLGATIVGGCCEVGPAHIAEIARQLNEAGHEIV